MKRLISYAAVLLAVFLAPCARADSESKMIGLGVPSEVAEFISIKLLTLDSSGRIVLPAVANKAVILGYSSKTKLSVTGDGVDTTTIVFGDGVPTRAHLDIRGATTDGDDDGYILIGAGGGNNLERGAAIVLYGNETTGGNHGDLKLDAGNVSGGDVEIIIPRTLGDNSSYRRAWYWPQGTGDFTNDLTYGTDIIFAKSGTTFRIDSDTAASACKGTGTFNGTTAVTISTTCAATSMHVSLTPTSDPTGSTAAYCWVASIANAVSFTVDCDQANDGTFSWLIVKEG